MVIDSSKIGMMSRSVEVVVARNSLNTHWDCILADEMKKRTPRASDRAFEIDHSQFSPGWSRSISSHTSISRSRLVNSSRNDSIIGITRLRSFREYDANRYCSEFDDIIHGSDISDLLALRGVSYCVLSARL